LTTLLCVAIACSQPEKTLLFTGQTMGTTYHITVTEGPGARSAGLHARIDQRLERLNQSMSTYLPDSEISRFNRSRSVDRAFPVSTDFYAVMAVAAEVYRISKGTWDGTVEPLVKLWGFGSPGGIDALPSRQSIAEALGKVGFDHIDVSGPGVIKKGRPDIAVDLASIAKGYGVDAVARLLGEAGFKSYLVEIGGEVYAAGRRPDGMPWKVGINQPDMSAPANAVYMALVLENQAMATSGDYRNYIEIEGRTYSHIIDPRSGYPVRNGVVSASVIAPTCTLADGLATALMVMGPREGLALLDRLDQVEGLIIVRRANGVLHNHWSRGLKP
jgi:thiamine biosynthesis lipoprotein